MCTVEPSVLIDMVTILALSGIIIFTLSLAKNH